MGNREKAIGELLSKIADELNITSTMQDKAVQSYHAVGDWIGRGIDYDVKIMPQGSMNLGTIIKPIDDSDDYDIDLVCLLEDGQQLEAEKIKEIIGDRLKNNTTYKMKMRREGKRCWTLDYEEFHMDILPCIPNDKYFAEPKFTDIKLTHKNDSGIYEFRYSNPWSYHKWFENRMLDILLTEKRILAKRNQVEIEAVPTYKIRTPLQQTIQLLKRHRDICFQENHENEPISIIITTLSALAYNGETNLYDALCQILRCMSQYIIKRNGEYWIENPVMKEENFADKWNIEPQKYLAFTKWLKQAEKEIIEDPLSAFGLDNISQKYQKSLGEAPVKRAIEKMGNATREKREGANLYINGLTGGLTTQASSVSTLVGDHTFYGD